MLAESPCTFFKDLECFYFSAYILVLESPYFRTHFQDLHFSSIAFASITQSMISVCRELWSSNMSVMLLSNRKFKFPQFRKYWILRFIKMTWFHRCEPTSRLGFFHEIVYDVHTCNLCVVVKTYELSPTLSFDNVTKVTRSNVIHNLAPVGLNRMKSAVVIH